MKKIELKHKKKIKELSRLNKELNKENQKINEKLDHKKELIDKYENELYKLNHEHKQKYKK